jgi:hypothetical protein
MQYCRGIILFLLFNFVLSTNITSQETIENSIQSIKNGDTQIFNTKNIIKMHGIDISIIFPKSWIIKKPEYSNIIADISIEKQNRDYFYDCLLLESNDLFIHNLIIGNDIKKVLNEDLKVLGKDNEILFSELRKYDNINGFFIYYKRMVKTKSGEIADSYFFRNGFVIDNRLVIINCQYGTKTDRKDKDNISSEIKNMEILSDLISDSIKHLGD